MHDASEFILETKHANKMQGLLPNQGHTGLGHDGEEIYRVLVTSDLQPLVKRQCLPSADCLAVPGD